jgi:isopentenyl-diphosphate delta-isomerase
MSDMTINRASRAIDEIEDCVILVDRSDNALGLMPKLEAHKCGVLHRAVSGFLFNANGELLIQRRAMSKYHSAGLWANSCCSHPRPNESSSECMRRRFIEELGVDTETQEFGTFLYEVRVEPELKEHEYVHGFSGFFEGEVTPNPREVMDYDWMPPYQLTRILQREPKSLCPWFRRYLAAGFVTDALQALDDTNGAAVLADS